MTQANPIVHVVDDDDSMRRAVMRLLRAAGLEARGYASAGELLLTGIPEGPGCLVLDVQMPGPSGLELQQALVKEATPLPIVFLSGHGDIPMSVRAMKAGAVDFLTKPIRSETLLKAVNAALLRDAQNRAAREQLRTLSARYEQLTAREREVFALVAEGRLNKQIAATIGNSERTVKAHRSQVMEKMQARSVADLVRFADQLKTIRGTIAQEQSAREG